MLRPNRDDAIQKVKRKRARKMMIEVSIIIPVYNSEEYLADCIDSIMEQEGCTYEIIIIDDGSTDSSYKIMKEYEEKYNNIRTIRQDNRGVCSARNAGIRVASGQYIIFIDSDDLLCPSSLENRIKEAEKCDFLVSSYIMIDDSGKEDSIYNLSEYDSIIWNKDETIIELYSCQRIGYQGYLWNKVFRTNIIKNNNIGFDETLFYNEDRLFILQYLLCCTTVYISNSIVYKYRTNLNGAMSKVNRISDSMFYKIKTEFDAFDKMKEILIKENIVAYDLCCLKEFYQYIIFFRKSSSEANSVRKFTRIKAIKSIPMILKMPNEIVPVLKKIKAIGHAMIMR